MIVVCSNCGTAGQYIQGSPLSEIQYHHTLLGRDRNNKRFVNHDYNMSPTCLTCHGTGGKVNAPNYAAAKTEAYKLKHLERIVSIHGYQPVRDWLDSARLQKRRGPEWQWVDRKLEEM